METTIKTKMIDHPLEDVLNIEPCTTVVEYTEVIAQPVVEMPNYDSKDDEIEEKLEEIYNIAIGNVAGITDELEIVEGKYKARIGEVAATMLNVALGAVREKSQLKMHKDKLNVGKGSDGVSNGKGNVTADRNEILRIFLDKKNKES